MKDLTSYIYSPLLGDILMQPSLKPNHTATIIFLHGAGETGQDRQGWVQVALRRRFAFAFIQILYPSAPLQYYTVEEGRENYIWFDEEEIGSDAKEMTGSVDSMADLIYKYIKDELVAKGTPYSRIIVGGFGMGGAMALHLGYRYCTQLAGIFTFSSYLNFDSAVYKNLKRTDTTNLPPLFSTHGDEDDLILYEDGEGTFNKLTSLGVKGVFHNIGNMSHNIGTAEVYLLIDWINNTLHFNL